MKSITSESCNIAWFKLADFVTRGEKERALSIYRLLVHSIADQAFTLQLQADLLLAFGDIMAVDIYHAAADVYKKEGNYQKAIAVYEHILLFNNDAKNLEALLDLSLQCQDSKYLTRFMAKLQVTDSALYEQAKNFLCGK